MRSFSAPVLGFSALLLALGSVGCSSDSPSDPGVVRGDNTPSSNLNPYGVPYPTNTGTNKRSGSIPGDAIANFSFQGYPDSTQRDAGLQEVKFADFYDPEVRNNIKVIHIQASGSWCTYCRSESQAIAPKLQAWRDKGVLYVLSMAEGPSPGNPSELKDLDAWITNYNVIGPSLLDSGNQQLGRFYNAAAMPWNATIDATTMEIVESHMGASTPEAMETLFDTIIGEIKERTGK